MTTSTQKIDKRKKYYIVIDTEATPQRKNNKVLPQNMLVYDIGWCVCDKLGNVYETHDYVVHDIFINEFEKMQSAYYVSKIPQYIEEIANNSRTVYPLLTIKDILYNCCKKWNITEIYAHNMRFDYHALNNTLNYVSDDKNNCGIFFPLNTTPCCTMKMFQECFANTLTYKRFCKNNDYLTKTGRARVTAEIINRFLIQDCNFIERHTALSDCLIEKDILAFCWKKHTSHSKRFLFN